jgi:hypothetical protein
MHRDVPIDIAEPTEAEASGQSVSAILTIVYFLTGYLIFGNQGMD